MEISLIAEADAAVVPWKILTAIGSGVALAIGTLWRRLEKQQAESRDDRKACAEREQQNHATLVTLSGEVGELKGRVGMAEQLQDVPAKIDELIGLSNDTLKAVHSISDDPSKSGIRNRDA